MKTNLLISNYDCHRSQNRYLIYLCCDFPYDRAPVPPSPIRKCCLFGSESESSSTYINLKIGLIRNSHTDPSQKWYNGGQKNLLFPALTVWNLNAINGRTKSNQFVIFLPTNSGRMTSNEFPMLRTTISDLLKTHPNKWKSKLSSKFN